MTFIDRITETTDSYFKKVRAFAITLGVSGFAVLAANADLQVLNPKLLIVVKVVILMCVAIAGTAQLSTAKATQDQIDQANAEAAAKSELQAKIDTAVAEAKRQSEEETKRARDEEIEELKAKHENEIATASTQISDLQNKLDITEKRLAEPVILPKTEDKVDNKDNVHQPVIDNTNEEPPTSGSGVITNQ